MKFIETTIQKNGFRGFFHPAEVDRDRAIIVLMSDGGNDFLDNVCAKWLVTKQQCNALCIAIRQKDDDDTGLHRWPLEYIEAGVHWLQKRGISKIGILGISMQACMALTAASLLHEISLVIAFAPCDFIPWGFYQGKGKREWPSGTSAFSWREKEIPFQPAGLSKEAYWKMYCDEKKQLGEMHTISIFEHSEELHPISENCFISLENIQGHIVLVGAEDDSMWNSVKYIHRMKKRSEDKNFSHRLELCIYPFGTHLLLPEQMLQAGPFPLGGIAARVFVSGRKNSAKCRMARLDIEKRLTGIIHQWGG